MDSKVETLYSELRKTRQELIDKLNDKNGSPLVRPFIQEELADIEDTLNKMELGMFGKCEISGEFIPEELLSMIPTIKTMEDCNKMDRFYRKAIY